MAHLIKLPFEIEKQHFTRHANYIQNMKEGEIMSLRLGESDFVVTKNRGSLYNLIFG